MQNSQNPRGQITRSEWTIGAFLIVSALTLLISGWSGGDIAYSLIHGPLWKPVGMAAVVGVATYALRRLAIFLVQGVIFASAEK